MAWESETSASGSDAIALKGTSKGALCCAHSNGKVFMLYILHVHVLVYIHLLVLEEKHLKSVSSLYLTNYAMYLLQFVFVFLIVTKL